MPEQHVTLRGAAARGTTVSAAVLRDLLDTLIEGSRRAARLQFEGRSTARGPVPGWLETVAAFDFTHVSEGSTRIEFSAPALGEVAQEVHRQEDFFRPLHDNMSALQLFEAGLRDAITGDLDSELFDAGLLVTYAKLGKVLAHGFDELAFGNGAGVVVNAGAIDRVKDLGTRVPQPRHTRVAGKLEQIQHSDRRFVLVVNGVSVRGVADDTVSPDDLAAMFGQHVVVTGDVVFRPSGSVMRMDSVKLELAGEEASVWEKLPRPLFEQPVPTTRYRVAQTPDTGLGAIIGRWPGDETDEEIAAAFEAIA